MRRKNGKEERGGGGELEWLIEERKEEREAEKNESGNERKTNLNTNQER